MKIGEINSKYIDYLRSEEYVEKYKLFDYINDIEFTTPEEVYRKIYSGLYDKLLEVTEDELDTEILCDEILYKLEDILNNYCLSLNDPSYDVDPTYNEYDNKQEQIIEDNKIPVLVPDEDGKPVIRYIDKRILEGKFEP